MYFTICELYSLGDDVISWDQHQPLNYKSVQLYVFRRDRQSMFFTPPHTQVPENFQGITD